MMAAADAPPTRLIKRVRSETAPTAAAWWSAKQQRLDHEHIDSNATKNSDNGSSNRHNTPSANAFTGGNAEDAAMRCDAPNSCASATDESSPGGPSVTSTLLQSLTSAASSFTWRLPATQPLAASEQYLNEQLVHVMGAAAAEMNATARRNGLSAQEQEASAQEEAAICHLRLVKSVWALVAGQTACTPAGKEKLEREKMEAEASVRSALDLVSLLLYLRAQEQTRQTELSERLAMLESELQRKAHQTQTLALDLDATRERLAQQENQIRAKELAFAHERKTLLVEKKSLDVMVARLQGVETAFRAQLRRKDAEYERLRKNLQDAVARSSKEQRGIAATKPLNGAAERKRAAQLAQSHESHVTRQIVENLERKKAELVGENEALVSSYGALQRQLEQLTSQYRKAAHLFLAKRGPDGQSDELLALATVPIDDFAPTALRMPSKQRLPQVIATSIDALQSKIEQFEAAMRADLEQDARDDREDAIAILQQKLADAHEIIDEQDQLLQASLLNAPVGSLVRRGAEDDRWRAARGTQDLDPEHLEELAEDLALQQCALSQQQTHAAQERQLLLDQALKLDHDRLAFEVEKLELVLGANRSRAIDGVADDVAMSDARSPIEPQQTRRRAATDVRVSIDSPQ